MKNPWMSKNPFMSMWLSGANSMLGATRARATAEAHRQTSAMMAEGTRQMMRFWTGAALIPGASPAKPKTTRSRRKPR